MLMLVFIGLISVAAGIAFFIYSVKNEDFDHATQLSLKPLEED